LRRARREEQIETVEPLRDAHAHVRREAEGEPHGVAFRRDARVVEAAASQRAVAVRDRLGLRDEDAEVVAVAVGRVVAERRVGRDRDARAVRRLDDARGDDATPARRGRRAVHKRCGFAGVCRRLPD
jgi:hypothetical protein